MFGTEYIVGAGIVVVLAILLKLNGDKEYPTRKTDGTVEAAYPFKRKHATITYNDGTEENIVYDEEEGTDEPLTAFIQFDRDCFTISKYNASSTVNRPEGNTDVPDTNIRYINLSNVRNVETTDVEELVAFTEFGVVKKQEKRNGSWKTIRYIYESQGHDFTIWPKNEFKQRHEQD